MIGKKVFAHTVTVCLTQYSKSAAPSTQLPFFDTPHCPTSNIKPATWPMKEGKLGCQSYNKSEIENQPRKSRATHPLLGLS